MQTDNHIKKGRALVVDDVPSVSHVHRLYCESLGYIADEADSGEKTYALFKPFKYQLVLLDLSMHDKDGLEVCSAIRRIDRQVIIVACGSYDYLKQLAIENGATAYINKPVTPEELKKILEGSYVNTNA